MAENTILQAGDWAAFAKLSNFKTKEEMDMAIRSWLYEYKHELKLSEEKLVKLISQLACKLKGVFAIKHKNLADLLGMSDKTVQRGLDRFAELGLISVYETRTSIKSKTPKGKGNPKGRGHNVYVINSIENIDFENIGKTVENAPIDATETAPENAGVQSVVQSVVSSRSIAKNADTPTVEEAKNEPDTGFSYTKPSKRINYKDISTKSVEPKKVFDESDLVGHWVPESFKQKALLLLETAENVNAAYSIVRKKVLKNKFVKWNLDDVEEFGRLTLNALYKKVKESQNDGEPVHKPLAYVSGIIKKVIKEKRNAILLEQFEQEQKLLEEQKQAELQKIGEVYGLSESSDSLLEKIVNKFKNPDFSIA